MEIGRPLSRTEEQYLATMDVKRDGALGRTISASDLLILLGAVGLITCVLNVMGASLAISIEETACLRMLVRQLPHSNSRKDNALTFGKGQIKLPTGYDKANTRFIDTNGTRNPFQHENCTYSDIVTNR